MLNSCDFNTEYTPHPADQWPLDGHLQAINWTRDNIIASATSIHIRFYHRPFQYLSFAFISAFLFKSNFRIAYGIWIDVMALSQTIYIFPRVCCCYMERPAHCCSCHLKYDEKTRRRKKRNAHSWYFRDLYAIIYYILCCSGKRSWKTIYILLGLLFFSSSLLSGCILIVLPSLYLCVCLLCNFYIRC